VTILLQYNIANGQAPAPVTAGPRRAVVVVFLGGNPPRKTRRRLPQRDDRERSAQPQGSAACNIARGDGRWDEAQHRSALADGRHAYFIAWDRTEPIGFVILRDWASPERTTLVKRIAVCQPGRGHGRALLSKVADAVFEQTSAWRLWLGLFPENTRAHRAYEAIGFQAEGITRGSAFFGGVNRDEVIMSLLRPEWAARRSKSGAQLP
jgi:RimJ/RimL family protein N-acetyltransferase